MEQKFGVARAGIYCIKEGKFVRSILFYPAFKIFILGLWMRFPHLSNYPFFLESFFLYA